MKNVTAQRSNTKPVPSSRPITMRDLVELIDKKALSQLREDRFLRLCDVLVKVGLSRSVLYRLMSKGQFPRVIKVAGSSVWSKNEIDAWMDTQKEEARV